MKSSNLAKRIFPALAIAAFAAFAQPAAPVVKAPVADSAKVVDTAKSAKAAVPAKAKKAAKAVKPGADPAKTIDSAKASEPTKGDAVRGAKTCEELKEKIAAKMESKGAKGAVLTVVPKDEAGKTGKIVGSCEGGSKKIVYTKG